MGSRFQIVDGTVKAELAKPYVFGDSDCFMLGIAIADALGGTDLRSRYQGSYSSLLGAQRALRKRGHKSLVTFFAGHLEMCPPAMAQFGDIVVLGLLDGEHVGVCLGTRFLTKTARGRETYALADCRAAFRTGALS